MSFRDIEGMDSQQGFSVQSIKMAIEIDILVQKRKI